MCAEASSSSQIRTARAVTEEFGEEAASKSGVISWAKIALSNSERDVQRVLSKQGSKLPIPMSTLTAEGVEIPWLAPTSWMGYIVDQGLWYRLAGLEFHEKHLAPHVWSQFWQNFRALQPHFSLFDMEGFDPRRTCACFLHGDEGRTLKKNGIMVTSLQSCLGTGFDEQRPSSRGTKRSLDGDVKLRVNYKGHSFTNRFVTSAIPKSHYETNPKVFHSAMDHLCQDLQQLLSEGVRDPLTQEVFYVAVIGVKGDWPYLQKMGNLNRAFNTGAKGGQDGEKSRGICHLCLAGQKLFPAEEINTFQPAWRVTVGVSCPWDRVPSVVRTLPHDHSNPASFFMPDLWHAFHLGVGKSFVSSAVQLALPFIAAANPHYRDFCKKHRRPPIVSRITGTLVSYRDKTGAVGAWSKGSVTTTMMLWVPALFSDLPHDPLLALAAEGAQKANDMFAFLYRAPAFLSKEEAMSVSSLGADF